MVNGLALRIMGRDADVDDLVQDAFVQALTSLHALKEPQAFGGWLGSIVVRTASKLLRRRKLMTRLGLRRPNDPIDLDLLVARTAPPDEAAELRAIYGAVDAMPVDVRVPLILRRVEGMPLEEIAEHTGVSLATVKRKITQGEELLMKRFADPKRAGEKLGGAA